MTCFLQLEDGSGFLRLEDGTGNLLLEACDDLVLLGGTPAGPNVNPNAHGFFYDAPYDAYQREQEVTKHQDKIISLKLEAQDNLLRQKDLSASKDKQSKRQIKALEREQISLMAAIRQAMAELEALAKQQETDRINAEQAAKQAILEQKNEAFIIMLAADPFFGIGGSMH